MRHPRFKEAALRPLMEKIIRQYRSPENRLGGSGEIRFWMKEDITLNIDEELIKTAVTNLLENALEAFTGREDGKDKISNAKIDVTVTAVKTFLKSRIKEVRLEVSDTGPGIDDADRENIYKPFFTSKTGDENHIGIGLTLSRWIIEAHGGYINVYSRKEIGTKFAITFPVDV
jgi:two-component system, NtrC family, nitrogen regulation sensor histidine kinase NtrY